MEKRAAKKAARKAAAQNGARRPAKKYELKTTATAASVTAFIDGVENETRRNDARTMLALMKRVTGQAPKMWGPTIVGFGRYRYSYDSGHSGEMCAAGFSPRKGATVVYVAPDFPEYPALLKKLGKHKTGVSCLYINTLADVDMTVLEEIVKKSYARTLRA